VLQAAKPAHTPATGSRQAETASAAARSGAQKEPRRRIAGISAEALHMRAVHRAAVFEAAGAIAEAAALGETAAGPTAEAAAAGVIKRPLLSCAFEARHSQRSSIDCT